MNSEIKKQLEAVLSRCNDLERGIRDIEIAKGALNDGEIQALLVSFDNEYPFQTFNYDTKKFSRVCFAERHPELIGKIRESIRYLVDEELEHLKKQYEDLVVEVPEI